jgi:predicted GNAT family N-acyltransferase
MAVSALANSTVAELYEVLQPVRSEVFVVEQACVFQDIDGTPSHAPAGQPSAGW